MKNTIPFNLFGEEQELCFTILGVRELERTLGRSLNQILASQYDGFDFVFAALPIALKRLPVAEYDEKITKYLTEENGRTIDSIALPILYAIFISGAAGKERQDFAMEKYYPELFKPEEAEPKNE